MVCINVNFLVVILYYSFVRCYIWGKLDKGCAGSLCISSYNCMRFYNYLLKINSFKELYHSSPTPKKVN